MPLLPGKKRENCYFYLVKYDVICFKNVIKKHKFFLFVLFNVKVLENCWTKILNEVNKVKLNAKYQNKTSQAV